MRKCAFLGRFLCGSSLEEDDEAGWDWSALASLLGERREKATRGGFMEIVVKEETVAPWTSGGLCSSFAEGDEEGGRWAVMTATGCATWRMAARSCSCTCEIGRAHV